MIIAKTIANKCNMFNLWKSATLKGYLKCNNRAVLWKSSVPFPQDRDLITIGSRTSPDKHKAFNPQLRTKQNKYLVLHSCFVWSVDKTQHSLQEKMWHVVSVRSFESIPVLVAWIHWNRAPRLFRE